MYLLEKTHKNKIDLIYIDPPYNTGNKDFTYGDSILDRNDGFKHSKWLSFMSRRLEYAKRLLSDIGFIFISIDDNEKSQLKMLCDDIFGEECFKAEFIVQSNPRGSQASKFFAIEHEYLLCYSKISDPKIEFGIEKNENNLSEYNLIDEHGRYRLLGLRQRGGEWRREQRPFLYYPIYVNPNNGKVSLEKSEEFCIESLPLRPSGEESRWTWSKEKFQKEKDLKTYQYFLPKTRDFLFSSFRLGNDKIKELTEKYGKETGKFDLRDYEKDGVPLRFEGGDLLYALHKATMFVKALKNEDGTWRLEGEINDTYDFIEFKNLKEYADNKEAILTDIFSTILNNFGVASSEYGVIKTYEVKIKFNFSNYEIK